MTVSMVTATIDWDAAMTFNQDKVALGEGGPFFYTVETSRSAAGNEWATLIRIRNDQNTQYLLCVPDEADNDVPDIVKYFDIPQSGADYGVCQAVNPNTSTYKFPDL